MTQKIHTEIFAVTPEWALHQLEVLQKAVDAGTFRNRPVSKTRVTQYAKDMKRGHWLLTHQGLAFDTAGNLLDGQHRLWAVIESGATIDMMVTFGLPVGHTEINRVNTMDVIDTGKSRNVAQQLLITHSIKNPNNVASISNVIGQIAAGSSKGRLFKGTISDALLILQMFGQDIEAILNLWTHAYKAPSSFLAPFVLYHHYDPEKGREFARAYFYMENLGKSHPALLLLRWRQTHPITGGAHRYEHAKVAISALHHFHFGAKNLTRLSANADALKWFNEINATHFERLRQAFFTAAEPQPVTTV
jgi:hypothetical protein